MLPQVFSRFRYEYTDHISFRQTVGWQRLHGCLYAIPIWLEYDTIDTDPTANGKLRRSLIPSTPEPAVVIDVERGFRGGIPQEVLLIVVEFCATTTVPEV